MDLLVQVGENRGLGVARSPLFVEAGVYVNKSTELTGGMNAIYALSLLLTSAIQLRVYRNKADSSGLL